jgi:hypothetical protein
MSRPQGGCLTQTAIGFDGNLSMLGAGSGLPVGSAGLAAN